MTKHLGRGARDVSDEDLRSSVLAGWGNLMRAAEAGGPSEEAAPALRCGALLALVLLLPHHAAPRLTAASLSPSRSEDELARLLDRTRLYPGDAATGADACECWLVPPCATPAR